MNARLYEFPPPEHGGQDREVAQDTPDDFLASFLDRGADGPFPFVSRNKVRNEPGGNEARYNYDATRHYAE